MTTVRECVYARFAVREKDQDKIILFPYTSIMVTIHFLNINRLTRKRGKKTNGLHILEIFY